jgi:hypothetical protein
MIAILYLVNGETVELNKEVSDELHEAVVNGLLDQSSVLSFNGYSYGMWSVVKIEWLGENK